MKYKIEEIEGIGPAYSAKLGAVGIKTTDDFLDKCASPAGRKAMAEKTGLKESQILKWTNMADLMRIKGVGEEFSELLEAAGVDTVKELKRRNPENLAAKMKEVNEEKKLTRAVPSLNEVTRWVEQAKSMDPKLTY
ncbi:MAG: DUF4332 domain-containing protein [Desulfomonilaceae bacterium]